MSSLSVLMISHDLVGPQMAGPGMRYWELAKVLARHVPTTLAAPDASASPPSQSSVRVVPYRRHDSDAMRSLVDAAQVIILPGDTLIEFPFVGTSDKYLVMDGYDPHTLENLAWSEGEPLEARLCGHRERLRILDLQCAAGDFFICASERQRMLWLGWLEARNRVNALLYDEDRTLRTLIDVVPTGIPAEPPRSTRPLVKGVIPGVATEDRVLVWGGGIWNWLDPLTLIKAVARVAKTCPQVRLYFPGPRHPYRESVPDMAMHQAAIKLSQELGLWGKHVFWGEWVPYQERQNYLLEADIGCSMHFETLETYFAFRTRILDYIWAGLPMIVTRGDATSELVKKYELGIIVDYGDVDGVADAILRLLAIPRERFRAQFDLARRDRSWETSAQPLVRFCQNPRWAPDKGMLDEWKTTRSQLGQIAQQKQEIARLQSIVTGYERGRFIRLTKWLHRAKRRLLG